MALRYRLVLLTHGTAPHLDAVVEAFAKYASPAPADLCCIVDGPGRLPPVEPLGLWRGFSHGQRLGFCAATAYAWQVAAADWSPLDPVQVNIGQVDYVFHLENDFLLTRDVDLSALAAVLDEQPTLAQMSLMRQPVSADDKLAGGVVAARPGEFTKRTAYFDRGQIPADYWLEHSAYFTTNPSLMRRAFMAENPWPGDRLPECEGRFGLDLVGRGYTFGVWGSGEQWVEHVGIRDGHGY